MRPSRKLAIAVLMTGVLAAASAAGQERGVDRRQQRSATVGAAGEVRLVGVLSKQYRGRCVEGGQIEWDDEHWEVGFVRLVVPRGLDLSALEGKLVIAVGTVAEPGPANAPDLLTAAAARNPRPAAPGIHCPQYQMRSDWVIAKGGTRIMRERAAGLPEQLAVTSVKTFDALSVEQQGDTLAAKLTNQTGKPLSNVQLRVHYEGCYGKPGTDVRTRKAGDLRPGRTAAATFPTVVAEDQGKWGLRHHRASSIEVAADKGTVLFDCDVPLGLFELESIECPE